MLSKSPGGARRRPWRAVSIFVALVTVATAVPNAAGAEHSGAQAEQAAREIQAAHDRANDASQAMFDAESEIDQLGIEIAATEAELATVEAEASAMQTELEEQAVREFTSSGTPSFPLLIDLGRTNDGITADVFAAVARGNAAIALDDFDAVMGEVTDPRAGSRSNRLRLQQHVRSSRS